MINVILNTQPNPYGFGQDWFLDVETNSCSKQFRLGQDVKVCSRLLGMTPKEVTNEIGSKDLRKKNIRKKLGEFILHKIGICYEEEIDTLQPWELSVD
jgi:hypothetical protein